MPHPLTSKILNILSEHRKIPDNEKESHTVTEFSDAIINKVDNMVLEGKKYDLWHQPSQKKRQYEEKP